MEPSGRSRSWSGLPSRGGPAGRGDLSHQPRSLAKVKGNVRRREVWEPGISRAGGWGGRGASPPVCSGALSPSRPGSSAARLSPHGASPAAGGGAGHSGLAPPPPAPPPRPPAPPPPAAAGTHDPLLERDQLLFLFLPSLEVVVDEGLQLHEVFVLALLLDVLWGTGPSPPPLLWNFRLPGPPGGRRLPAPLATG